MDYHLFRKSVAGKNGKQIKRWYYWFYDACGKQIKKSCIQCTTKAEAEEFIGALPPLKILHKQKTVAKVAEYMFIPGSEHYNRCIQFGKTFKPNTIVSARFYISYIIKHWGMYQFNELTPQMIQSHLLACERSGSWKNSVLETFMEIFREATWQGVPVTIPIFTRFKRNSCKQSVLSTAELQQLFKKEHFSGEMFYLFFLLCLSAGMRLGEIRAVRVSQLLAQKQAVIVDGFLSRTGERYPFNKTGSIDHPRYRVVLIPEFVTAVLKSYIIEHALNYDNYVFTFNQKPVSPGLAQKEFKRALQKAGIYTKNRKITPHALRYTYVTRMRRLVDTSSTMLMAGHSSQQMSDHYTRFELEETVKQLTPLLPVINKFFE